ncbi:SPOR domain-containing protein [Gilvimarinus sp. F26214L]|uniref:SPOR domain-containing protein n=1 Tax=Gilvimarinus sp. DZF01 TaxID=3461371 RepID=UPI004045D9C7
MDDGLKQRLIGAIVLLAVAVLFLPSLFREDARRSVDLTTQIPPEPELRTEMLEIPDPVQPQDIPPAKPLEKNYPHEEPQTAATEDETADEEPANDAAEPVTSAEPAQRPAPTLTDEGVPRGWSLQVASFRSAERAQSMRQRLLDAGYKSYIREGSTGQGRVHRVFVGPKIDKAVAEADKQRIDEDFKTKSLIVEFAP